MSSLDNPANRNNFNLDLVFSEDRCERPSFALQMSVQSIRRIARIVRLHEVSQLRQRFAQSQLVKEGLQD
jgi:hypothetical protein